MHIRKCAKFNFHCVVRLNGNYLTKTFTVKKTCSQWGRQQERLNERGRNRDISKNSTFRKIIEGYKKECPPLLKDRYKVSNQLKRVYLKSSGIYSCGGSNLPEATKSAYNLLSK